VQHIAEWLEKLGLGQYTERFAANDIDLEILCDLTDPDLEKIGVTSLGHRRKLLRAITELKEKRAPSLTAVSVVPDGHRQADAAERRQLTVMFCDLVGSTALSARLDPEDLRDIIGAYHRCCAELVERNHGFVAKYMGDGVLAYFGYPQAHEHDAEAAVRAGLALVEAVPKLKTAASAPLQLRVGIATGLVVVGDLIGAGAAQEQAVVGETPNLAARLQALAEPGAVVIASSTRGLTGGLFEYRDLGAVALKGFADKVPAWQVLSTGAVESRFEALRATTTPLVGRDEEIELLLRRWEQVKRGEGCIVLVSGEPGIGKSRIAQTVVERLSGQLYTRLRNFCSPHHQDSALYPNIMQLGRVAGFRREDTAEQRLDKLEALLSEATNDLSEAVPLLADLLSIPVGNRYPPLHLTPQKRKERTLHALIAQVQGLAARQPVLIIFEDIHWSDPTTREMLDLLIDRVPTMQVLVIITFRPEFSPPWIGRPQVTLISLSRLPARQRAEMISHVVHGKALPREIIAQIVDRTDGVPLFVEELTKAVVESGLLTNSGEGYTVAGPVPPLAIPTSLQASLLARLDRLAPTRELAQIGATLGRSFSYEMISAMAAMPQQQLDDALAELVRAELIFQRGIPPDAEYTFKHALVQSAAYSTLLRDRRQQLHARIASVLEAKFPDVVAAQPQLLAHHCTEASLNEKAIAFWLRAGQQALQRSAMVEAEAQLLKGLALLTGVPDGPNRQQQELDLQTALGQALFATKGYATSDVGDTFARASTLAGNLGRPDYQVPLLYGHWTHHFVRSEHKLALPLANRIEEIGKQRGDGTARLLGHSTHGATCCLLGEFELAHTHLKQCHEMVDPVHRAAFVTLTGVDQYPIMLLYLSLTLTYLGYLDQAGARLKEALSAARELGHSYTLVLALAWVTVVKALMRSHREAEQHAQELFTLSNEHGYAFFSSVGMILREWALTELTSAHDGVSLLEEALSAYRTTDAVLRVPHFLLLLAETHAKLGSPIKGLNCLAEAEPIANSTDEHTEQAEVYRLRGDLLLGMGDRVAAERNYHQALGLATRQGAKIYELRAAASLARLWRDQAKQDAARTLLQPIYGWFTEGFGTPDLKEAKTLLDELA
jgi:class 3 adenylate cyclase/predicted ATPase